MQRNGKEQYLEVLRVFCIYWVLYNHTGPFGFLRFLDTPFGADFCVNLLFSGFCKIAVPIFLMISGAVLLGKNSETLSQLFKTRILRFVLLIIINSIYNILFFINYDPLNHSREAAVLFGRWYSTTDYCTYYLWLYLGFLISLPVLRQICRDRRLVRYSITVFAVLSIVPQLISNFFHYNTFILLQYTSLFSFWLMYPLMGYYIATFENDVFTKAMVKKVALYFIGGGLALQGLVGFYHVKAGLAAPADYLTLFPAAGVFFLARAMFMNRELPPKLWRIVQLIAPTTLGTFLLSGVLQWKLLPVYTFLAGIIHMQLAALIWVFVSMMICSAVIFVLRLLPFIRRIL